MKRRERQVELISLLQPYKLTHKTQKINLFGKGIVKIDEPYTAQDFTFISQIQTLDLSHNAIQQVKNLIYFTSLRHLNISHNKIHSQDDIIKLINPVRTIIGRELDKIQIKGNPFLKHLLKPELKRLLLAIQNDLNIFTKHQIYSFDIFVQKSTQMFYINSISNRTKMHIQLCNQFIMNAPNQKYQTVETYYRLVRSQVQVKMQNDYLIYQVRKMIACAIPLQKFISSTNQSSSLQLNHNSLLSLHLNQQGCNLDKLIKEEKIKLFQSIELLLNIRKNQSKKNTQQGKNYSIKQSKQPKRQQNQETKPVKLQKSVIKQNILFKNYYQTPIKNYNLLTVPKQQFQQKRTNTINIKQKQRQRYSSKQSEKLKSQTNKSDFNSLQKIKQQQYSNPNIRNQSKVLDNQQIKSKLYSNQFTHKQVNSSLHSNQFNSSIKNYVKNSQFHKIEQSTKKQINPSIQENVIQDQIKFQKIFFQMLTKNNPVYHLLYSPLESLKPKQKDLLISNLNNMLKEKVKVIERLQKKIKQYEQLDSVNIQLRQNLYIMNCKKEEVQQNMKFIQQNLRIHVQQSEKMSNYIQQLQNSLRKVKLQKENDLLEQKSIMKEYQLKQIVKQRQNQLQDNEQKIIVKRQKLIKAKYFSMICLRAYKLYQFKQKTSQIKVNQAYLIKQNCFKQWFYDTQLNKAKTKLKKTIFKNSLQKFKQNASNIIYQRLKDTQNTRYIISLKKKLSMANFRKIQQCIKAFKSKMIISELTSNKFYKQTQHKQKYQVFQYLKNCITEKDRARQAQLSIKAFQHYQSTLEKKVFREWLIWIKFLFHKQVEIRVIHKQKQCKSVIQNISLFYLQSKEFQSKTIQLDMYLRTIRKSSYCQRFITNSKEDNKKFKFAQKNIQIWMKNNYFSDFMETIRSFKLTQRIKHQDQIKIKRAMMYEDDQRFKKLIRISFTKKKLYSVFNQYRISQIQQQKKGFLVQSFSKKNQMLHFFSSLAKNHFKKQLFDNKKSQLRLLLRPKLLFDLNQYTASTFFASLKQMRRHKKLLIIFLTNKNQRITLKYFSKLRIQTLQQKSSYYMSKLNELGPEIKQIQDRQLTTNNQKIQLLRQLSDKNFLVDQYQKEIRQLRVLLQSKQIKYQKLRDIYAQAVGLTHRQTLTEVSQSKKYSFSSPDSNFQNIKIAKNYSKYEPERDYSSSIKLNMLSDKYYQNRNSQEYLHPLYGKQMKIIDQDNEFQEKYRSEVEDSELNQNSQNNLKFQYLKDSFRRF